MSKSQFKEQGRADVGEVVRELGLAEGSIAIALPDSPWPLRDRRRA